jgi:hypothetical protein
MANDFGSFGNVSPDQMQAVRNALARRQQGGNVGALNQQSAASPTASPQPPQPMGGPEMPGTMTASGQTTGQLPVGQEGAGAEVPVGNEEAVLIIKALASRLKALSGGQ